MHITAASNLDTDIPSNPNDDPDGCEWVNVSSGTSLPRLSRIKGRYTVVVVVVHVYIKLPNLFQLGLSLTLTKWCYIKHDHWASSEFLHFTWQTWKTMISLQRYDQSSQNLAQWCSFSSAQVVNKITLKNRTWRMADALEKPILHHHDILWFFKIFIMAAFCNLWFLKLKFVTAVHFRDMFNISMPNFVDISHTTAEISQFFTFFKWNLKICQMIALNMA